MKSMIRADSSAARVFEITPTQYAAFRFSVPRWMMVNIQLIATAPVNLLLERSEDKDDYEPGISHSGPQWLRRRELDETLGIDPGIWYLIVEGVTEPSRGQVKVRLD